MKNIFKILGMTAVVLMISSITISASTEMTYVQYEDELTLVSEKEKTVRETIASEQAAIEDIKQQISNIEQQISSVSAERYTLTGASESDVATMESEIDELAQLLSALEGLPPEELPKRMADIKKVQARLAELSKKPASYLFKVSEKIVRISAIADRLTATASAIQPSKQKSYSSTSTYTVQLKPGNRECLYTIANSADVYGDPSQWPKIYRANKERIDGTHERYVKKNPQSKFANPEDLIFPGQTFDIPR